VVERKNPNWVEEVEPNKGEQVVIEASVLEKKSAAHPLACVEEEGYIARREL
jgi:hypothetical protein